MQDLQSQEDILQARIQAMEYELSMRRARTERLRAMINVVQTFQASSSHLHPYYHLLLQQEGKVASHHP